MGSNVTLKFPPVRFTIILIGFCSAKRICICVLFPFSKMLRNAIEEYFFRFLSGFRCIFNVIVRPKKVESLGSCVFSNSALTQVDTIYH